MSWHVLFRVLPALSFACLAFTGCRTAPWPANRPPDVPPLAWEGEGRTIWPLFDWISTDHQRLRALRPLFAWEADDEAGWHELDILWPLFHSSHRHIGDPERERMRLRVLPLLSYKANSSPILAPWRFTLFPILYAGQTGPDPEQRYTIVFPLWWQANDARVFFPIFWSSPLTFKALFPLWGRFDDMWGRDRLEFALFPLWARSHWRSEAITDTYLWPLFAWTRGGDAHGLRAWPLVGWSGERDKWLEGFVLWPIGHFRRATLPDGRPNNLTFIFPFRFQWEIGDTRLNVRWPLWGTYDTPGHSSWSIAWPLWQHTVNRRHDYTESRLLWFIYRRRVGETQRAFQIFPFYGMRERPGRRVHWVLFPLYSHFESWLDPEKQDGVRWSHDVRMLLPLWVSTHRWRGEGSEREWVKRRWIFPLFLKHEEGTGREVTKGLWPLLITRSRGYERSWGMLFRLWERGHREDGSHWSRLLGPLWRKEVSANGDVSTAYRGIVFQRARRPGAKVWRLFGGLVARRSDVDGVKWSWFNFGVRLEESLRESGAEDQ
jgi:hypothetical protein